MKNFLASALCALLLLTAGCEQPPEEPPVKQVNPPAQPQSDSKPESKPEVKLEPPPAPKSDPIPEPVKEESPVKNERTERSLSIKVYYPDDSGMKLVAVEREILVDDATDKYTAAVEALLDEPDEDNLTKIFPKNAAIRSVKVVDGLAIVDLDGGITKNFVGGSTGEEFLIGSVVDTLTNFPEVTHVQFLVDGKEIETLSGHMDLSTPLERMNSLTE